MSEFSVNRELCIKDYICIEQCPSRIISVDYDTGLPMISVELEKYCLKCSHCMIYCPTGACSLKTFKGNTLKSINTKLLPTQDQSEIFLKSRRSVRQFKNEVVEHDKILKILEIAKYSPSASNRREIRWIIIEKQKTMNDLIKLYNIWIKEQLSNNKLDDGSVRRYDLIQQGYDPIFRGAPHLAITVTKKDYKWKEDAIIATTYFELAAHSLTIGTCWGGLFLNSIHSNKSLCNILGINKDEQAVGLLLFGYPYIPICSTLPLRKNTDFQFI